MVGLTDALASTLPDPESVVLSRSDPHVRLYYRYHRETLVGGKHLCVVVKVDDEVAFAVTAYLTDRIKRGQRLWPEST